MSNLLENPRARRALVARIHREADTVPGARAVRALRKDSDRIAEDFVSPLHVQFRALGIHVAAVAPTVGGLLLESKEDVRKRVNAILTAAGIGAWIKTRFEPIYERLYLRVGRITMSTLARSQVPVTARDKIEARMLREGGKRLGLLDIRKQVKESLFRIIDVGRDMGLNPNQTAKMIADLVPKGRYINAGSTYRARLIARTEVLHAQRIASIESYRRSGGAVKGVIAFDGDYDDECIARNGTEYTFEEAEDEAYITHPNCVLAFGPVT